MIYFDFTCLYEHNINILHVRVAVAMANNELSSKKIPVIVEEKCEIYVHSCLDGKLSKLGDFQLYLLSSNLCVKNIRNKRRSKGEKGRKS